MKKLSKFMKIHHLAAFALACGFSEVQAEEELYDEPFTINEGVPNPEGFFSTQEEPSNAQEEFSSVQEESSNAQDELSNGQEEPFNIAQEEPSNTIQEEPSYDVQTVSYNDIPPMEGFAPSQPTSQPMIQLDSRASTETFHNNATLPQAIPMIHGIHIVGDPTQFSPDGKYENSGVNYHDVDIPGDNEDLRDHLEKNFCGQQLNETYVPRLRSAIQNHYTENGHPLVIVCIPPQNVSSGTVQVLVHEATLGEVRTTGNCWFSDGLLRSYISLSPGDTIDSDSLMNDVAWMNRNTFRFTRVSFTPGCETGTTDIELITTERRPFRFYFGTDNLGSDLTTQTRLFAGFNAGNVFGYDHTFGYQYTTSADFYRFQSHTLNYIVPFSWKHQLMVYGGYAEVHPHIRDFHSRGRSYQASTRYMIPFKPLYGDTFNEVKFGFDFKSTNNNLEFTDSGKTSVITGTVNLSQLMVGYNYGGNYGRHELLGNVQAYGSPGQLFDKERKRDYESLRYKAQPTYAYGQFTGGYNYHFSWGSEVAFLVRTQYSTTNLLPSEQFVIGGFDTVRGYKEFEVVTDNGLIANVELRSPVYSFIGNYFDVGCGLKDELRLLAFIDYGKGFNHRLFHKERRDYQLLSVGPGLRYDLNDYLSARLDWGIKLKRSSKLYGWGSKVHFGLIATY